jgi:hypothetical protein
MLRMTVDKWLPVAVLEVRAKGNCGPRCACTASRAAFWLLICLVLSGVFATGVRAETGERFSLPAGNIRPKNGLRLTVDSRWIDASGYRPIRVEATPWPPGPAPADRSLRVVLWPHPYHWGRRAVAVSQVLELPEGATVARATVSVPQDYAWSSLGVEVYEGGVRLEDLWETSTGQFFSYRGTDWSESAPSVLIIDPDVPDRSERAAMARRWQFGGGTEPIPERTLPDIRPLIARFAYADEYAGAVEKQRPVGSGGDLDTLVQLQESTRIEMLPFGELPERWIDFTMFDLICIGRSDLTQLVEQHPVRWQAIRDWLVSGVTLCIYDMALDAADLQELDQLLKLPPHAEDSSGTEVIDRWQAPRASHRNDMIKGWPVQTTWAQDDASGQRPPSVAADAAGPDAQAQFVLRQAGLGRVVAIRSDEPFSEEGNHLTWMLNEIGSENWMWYRRHGISLHRENPEYWNWIVPGVGRAPVGSYLLLITLFVIVIGPVNYFWLRRWKRLYLLLVTVPLGAALVTFALLNYALLTDGLGVRVRVRSLTHLDQRNQQAVSWSRQSYYAGLAPSRGLQFPETAAFYPIEQDPADRHRQVGHRRLRWDDGQHLTSGYMTSRATSQFLVVQSGRSERELVVRSDQDAAPSVENRLGADLVWLVLRNADGRFFRGEALAAGQTARLQPSEPTTATAELQRWYEDFRPEFPESYDPNYYRNTFGFSRRHYWTGVDHEFLPPSLSQGLLERNLRFQTRSGIDGLPQRSYVAVTGSGVEVPLGYPRLREESSFHLVYGHW